MIVLRIIIILIIMLKSIHVPLPEEVVVVSFAYMQYHGFNSIFVVCSMHTCVKLYWHGIFAYGTYVHVQ